LKLFGFSTSPDNFLKRAPATFSNERRLDTNGMDAKAYVFVSKAISVVGQFVSYSAWINTAWVRNLHTAVFQPRWFVPQSASNSLSWFVS
jgi:hypothetical protein